MKKRPLAIASAGAFVAALSTSLVAVSAPVIARDFNVSPADVSWVLSAYLLAVSCLLAIAGKAADVLGRKRVYLTGFAFFIAGSAMCAVAPELRALIGARAMQGAGAAMLMAVGPAIVTRSVAPNQRARGLGIQLAATYVGLTLGPSVGGLLASRIGWQAVFVVIAGVGVACAAFAFLFLDGDDHATPPEDERPKLSTLDLPGAVLFGVGLAAFIVAIKRAQEDGWTSKSALMIAAFAVVSLAIFARHEALHATPVLPLNLLKTPPFAFGVLGATILYTVTFMLAYLLPFHLQRTSGLSPAQAGAFMTAQPAMMAITAPVAGLIADKWGPRLPSALGMLAIGCGMACVANTAISPSVMLVLSLMLVGFGAGLYVAPNSALIMGAAPRERQGVAAAMVATARNVGMTLGIAAAASLEVVIGFRHALFVASAVAVLGAMLGFVRPVVASSTRSS